MSTILLVEDDRSIADALAAFLRREGFDVQVTPDAAGAREQARRGPDLVVLDWMLPDGQGIDLLREWRLDRRTFPVLFLTARDDLIDKVLGLEMGADDYVTKPFEPRELLARVKARLRTHAGATPAGATPASQVAVGELVLDLERREATFEGRTLTLTRMELELLRVLMASPGRVFSRDELLACAWGYDACPTTRTVDTHILQLRQKTRADLFESVRGVGYRLRAPGLTSP